VKQHESVLKAGVLKAGVLKAGVLKEDRYYHRLLLQKGL
jgi:hypothetical protein